jgi:E1A-binding protein p400
VNDQRWERPLLYSSDLRAAVTVQLDGAQGVIRQAQCPSLWKTHTNALRRAVLTPVERFMRLTDVVAKFVVVVPKAVAPCPVLVAPRAPLPPAWDTRVVAGHVATTMGALTEIQEAVVRMQVSFPDKWLVQYDCGKLQVGTCVSL